MERRYQKLVRKVKGYLLREQRKKSSMGKIVRSLGTRLFDERYWRWERRSVAVGGGWGAAAAVSPLPLQSLWGILASLWKKGNVPVAVLMAWLSPPFFMLVFTPVQWWVGNFLFKIVGLDGSQASFDSVKHAIHVSYQDMSLAPFEQFNYWILGLEWLLGVILTCTATGLLVYGLILALWELIAPSGRQK